MYHRIQLMSRSTLLSSPCFQVAALSERSQRLEAELQAARGREAQLQEELQAAKRAASALQRTPSKIGGACGLAGRLVRCHGDCVLQS